MLLGDSPALKKPKRDQTVIRPCYGVLRDRIHGSKCTRALEAISLGQLQGMFVADYPRFQGMSENVAAGYLVAQWR